MYDVRFRKSLIRLRNLFVRFKKSFERFLKSFIRMVVIKKFFNFILYFSQYDCNCNQCTTYALSWVFLSSRGVLELIRTIKSHCPPSLYHMFLIIKSFIHRRMEDMCSIVRLFYFEHIIFILIRWGSFTLFSSIQYLQNRHYFICIRFKYRFVFLSQKPIFRCYSYHSFDTIIIRGELISWTLHTLFM